LASFGLTAGPTILIAHGDPDAPDRIDIGHYQRTHSVWKDTPASTGDHRIRIRPTLAQHLLLGADEPPDDEAERRRWIAEIDRRAHAAAWTPDELSIEGTPAPGFSLSERTTWIAFVEVGPLWVYAHSRAARPDRLDLVAI
jgi:hypothetical protein